MQQGLALARSAQRIAGLAMAAAAPEWSNFTGYKTYGDRSNVVTAAARSGLPPWRVIDGGGAETATVSIGDCLLICA